MNRKSTSDDGESVLHANVDTYLYQWVWREHVLKGMGPQERMELVSAHVSTSLSPGKKRLAAAPRRISFSKAINAPKKISPR